MNTRGLMELIVLNIGLDLGIISPTLFGHDGHHGAGNYHDDLPNVAPLAKPECIRIHTTAGTGVT